MSAEDAAQVCGANHSEKGHARADAGSSRCERELATAQAEAAVAPPGGLFVSIFGVTSMYSRWYLWHCRVLLLMQSHNRVMVECDFGLLGYMSRYQ